MRCAKSSAAGERLQTGRAISKGWRCCAELAQQLLSNLVPLTPGYFLQYRGLADDQDIEFLVRSKHGSDHAMHIYMQAIPCVCHARATHTRTPCTRTCKRAHALHIVFTWSAEGLLGAAALRPAVALGNTAAGSLEPGAGWESAAA